MLFSFEEILIMNQKAFLLFTLVFCFFKSGFISAQNCDTASVPRGYIVPPERRFLCQSDTLILEGLTDSEPRWFKNGIEIPGANSRELRVTEPGTYAVRNYRNGCYSIYYDSVTITFLNRKRPVPRQLSINAQPTQAGQLFTLNVQNTGNPAAVSHSWFRGGVLQPNAGSSYSTRNLGVFRVRTDSLQCSSFSNAVAVQPPGAVVPVICSSTATHELFPNSGVKIFWTPPSNPNIQNIKIYYKKGFSSNYFNNLQDPATGLFWDDTIFYNASFDIRITALVNVPSLGVQYESDFSSPNKTIFLKVYSSPSGVVPRNVLIWNTYEGFPVEKSVVLRSVTGISGTYVALDTIYNSDNIYEDVNPPAGAFYRIEALTSSNCQTWARQAVTDGIQANVRKSISNNAAKTQSVNPMVQPPYLTEGMVYAGFNRSVPQSNTDLVLLNGYPSGGFWSGPDVSASGVFQPVSCGTKKLVYEKIGLGRDSLFITVWPAGVTSDPVSIATGPFAVCGASNVTFTGSPTGGTWASPLSSAGVLNASGFRGKNILVQYSRTLNGCSYRAVRVVPVFPSTPAIQVSGTILPCSTQSVNLSLNLPQQGAMVYQWRRNNVIIDGAGTNTYEATESGAYTASVSYYGDPFLFPPPLCTLSTPARTIAIDNAAPPAPPVIQRSGTVLSMSNYSGGANLWYRNGAEIAGQTGSSLNLSASGLYHARRREGNCQSELSNAISYDLLVFSEESQASGLRLFPNPATELIRVESVGDAITGINLTDFLGRKLPAEWKSSGGSVSVDLSRLPPGSYHLSVRTRAGALHHRVLLRR